MSAKMEAAERLAEAASHALDALMSARHWFEDIAEAPEDESDGFVNEAKDVVDAAYWALEGYLNYYRAQPAPAKSGWRTMDSAPKDGTFLWITDGRSIYLASEGQHGWHFASNGINISMTPTHWQPGVTEKPRSFPAIPPADEA